MNSFIEEVELFLAEYHLSYTDIKEEEDRVVVCSLNDCHFDIDDVYNAAAFVDHKLFSGFVLSDESDKMFFVKRR